MDVPLDWPAEIINVLIHVTQQHVPISHRASSKTISPSVNFVHLVLSLMPEMDVKKKFCVLVTQNVLTKKHVSIRYALIHANNPIHVHLTKNVKYKNINKFVFEFANVKNKPTVDHRWFVMDVTVYHNKIQEIQRDVNIVHQVCSVIQSREPA
jgi:2-phosphoglycerate kinase